MGESVRITEVAPRDGLQNEPGVIATADKIRLVELCAATGVDEVEVTSFVSPRWVPQLADGAEVFRALRLGSPFPEGRGLGLGGSNKRKRRSLVAIETPPREPVTVHRAIALRHALTGPEKAVWTVLRAKRLSGYKFRRQEPFGPFILDFYCGSHGLVIELDGQTHVGELARERDERRTSYLERLGLRLIRFGDDAAVHDTDRVATAILRALHEIENCAKRPESFGRSGNRPSEPGRSPNPRPLPSGKGRKAAVLSALVPNVKGLDSALEVNEEVGRGSIGKVSVFTAASETFSRKNTNATIEGSIERFRPVVIKAHAHDLPVRGYVSCAIACPFEGPIEPGMVADVARRLWEIGVDEIDLGDTIGAGTPETVRAVLAAATEVLGWTEDFGGPPDDESLTLHLHDTFGRAAECVKAALDMGVRSFDGSVAGLGGCPYASTPGKRAPGNISTETLVRTVHAAGFETGVDLDRLAEAAKFARDIVDDARAKAAKGGGEGGANT